MEEVIWCPSCGLKMEYYIKHKFWKCPGCYSEFWPDMRKRKELEQEERYRTAQKQAKAQARNSVSSCLAPEPQPYYLVPGGPRKSQSKSGRKRKKPKKYYRGEYLEV